MGAVSYEATHYKNGRIDRKAEADEYVNGKWNKVLQSTIRDGIYYALVYYVGDERNEPHTYIMTARVSTWHGEFFIKEVSEDCGPAWYDCPVSYLDKADAPRTAIASEWRDECRRRAAQRKAVDGARRVRWHVPERSGLKFRDESLGGRTILLTRDSRKWVADIDGYRVRVPLKYVNIDDLEVAA